MANSSYEEKIWPILEREISGEQVAGIDHIRRSVARAKKFGPVFNADMEVLVPAAMLHDIGVVSDRKYHYIKGKERAAEILKEVGYPQDKIGEVLHAIEAHSRYGGISPETVEAKLMRDIDAIDYVGTIGLARSIVRGLNDGSFDGNIENLPSLLKKIISNTRSDGIYHDEIRKIVDDGNKYLEVFLAQLEKELG